MSKQTNAVEPLVFSPLSFSHKEQVEAIRMASGNTLYVYTFASLFSWQEAEKYSICLRSDAFLVKNAAEGTNAYLFPCGSDSGKKQLIDALLLTENPVFYTVRDEDKQFLEREYPQQFAFSECPAQFPYLYDKEAQITLSGKPYKSLRHQINLGRAVAQEWRSEPLGKSNVERALAITGRWAEERGNPHYGDTAACKTALQNFEQLSMWGLIFQADGKDVAFVAGTFVTPEIFDISFCKVLDRRCDCYIKWALYCALPEAVKIVDSEEDLGLEGLRKHKMLRIPKALTRVWKGSFNL